MEKQTEEHTITFEWHSILRDLLKNFWLVVLAVLIAGMGLDLVTESLYSPEYTSTATLAVQAKAGSIDPYFNLSTASEMAEIFTHVFVQPSVQQLAAEHLGIPAFRGRIAASVLGETNLLSLSVTADTPEEAFRLLQAVLEIYPHLSEAVFSNAVIDILQTPEVPVWPSNTMTPSRRTMLLALSALLTGGLIVLLSVLRNTVKNEKGFADKIDARLLGTVAHAKPPLLKRGLWKSVHTSILINDIHTDLKFCEDYRKIAGKLEYLQKTKGCKIFALTSVAENEGKSTAAVNSSLALAECGYRVALLDLDVRKPAVYKMLDYTGDIPVQLPDILADVRAEQPVRLYRYRKSSLYLALNRTSHRDTGWISSERTRQFLANLREKMDFILIDTSPTSVSADALMLASLADRAILVVRTDRVASEDINDTILTMQNTGVQLAGCILNDVFRPFAFFGQMGDTENKPYGSYRYREEISSCSNCWNSIPSDETEQETTPEAEQAAAPAADDP